MKILMITMSMNIGGAETHILELCRELRADGNDITLASFGGVYADEIEECGIRHVKLPLHSKDPVSVIKSYRGLGKLIVTERYDIVHAHARIPAFITGLLHDRITSGDGRKFRFVTTAHLNFTTNALLRRISRWGEHVMAVSDDITDYLVDEYGYPRDKIDVTINGIDTVKFSPDTDFSGVLGEHGLEGDRRRIVYMSRLDEDRADPAFRLLEIAPAIAGRYPDTDIIIVGGGNVFGKIKEIADRVNRDAGRSLVTLTGPVSNTNEYCAAADVFIGVSRSALEAMAAAKPVIIAGNQGALGLFDGTKIKDAVDTNFCCRGFPVADGESLMKDICAVLDMSEDGRKAVGRYNRNFILENYTAKRMARDYTEMYRKVLASPVPVNPSRTSPDIVMSGYYGFGNLGDESLLDVITQSLAEEIPDVKIVALTKSPKNDTKRTGLGSVSRFNVFEMDSVLSRTRLLVSGGGSLLQDATSKRSLGYYAGVMNAAKKRGAKVAVLANGIGPVRYETNREKTRKVIDSADYVSVRDGGSLEELRSLGVGDPGGISVSADPAFLIKPAEAHALDRVLRKNGLDGKKFFAVSLRPLKSQKNRKAPVSEADASVADRVAAVCLEIYERYGLTPVIIPMQNVQDEKICRLLCDSLDSAGADAVLMKPESARELIGVLGAAEFVIGMRLHSIIFASSAGTPVIGLSYDPKVSSMMRELGQNYVIDLESGESFSPVLSGYVDSVWRDREAIGRDLAERAGKMREKCIADMKAIHGLLK